MGIDTSMSIYPLLKANGLGFKWRLPATRSRDEGFARIVLLFGISGKVARQSEPAHCEAHGEGCVSELEVMANRSFGTGLKRQNLLNLTARTPLVYSEAISQMPETLRTLATLKFRRRGRLQPMSGGFCLA